MKKIAIVLIICLTLSAFAGCARTDERGEEMATLTQPEQIVQKEEGAEQKEPIDIDSADEAEEETKVPEQLQEQPGEESEEKETETPQTTEKKQVVRESVPEGSQFDLYTLSSQPNHCMPLLDVVGTSLTFEELQKELDPKTSIVFRGKLNGKSTQYKMENYPIPHNETPILVQEVYYGNVKAGDVISYYEDMYVHLHDGEPVLHHYKGTKLLEKDQEYLFIVHNVGPLHEGGEDVYSTKDLFDRFVPISEVKTLQSKKELGKKEQRKLDALTYYYLGQRGEETE